jgi:UDP-glucose 4-epimerase
LANRLAKERSALQLVSYFSPATGVTASETVKLVRADLRDEENWLGLLQAADAIIHLSWRTDLRAAEANPEGDRRLNVEPVRALIRAARTFGRPVPVIFASTVTIAGHSPQLPVSEQTPDQPCTVYDRHKLECEQMFREAASEGVLNACSLRLANVYGYGSGVPSTNSNRGILNEIMRRAASGETLTLYGRGAYVRDFIFISDVVDAFCRALASSRALVGGHYIIATGRGYSLAEAFCLVAREALHSTGRTVRIKHVAEPPDLYPIERRSFIGDSTLFEKLTAWRAHTDLQSGIRDYFKRRGIAVHDVIAPTEAREPST